MAKSGETGNTRKPAPSKKAGAKAAARNTAGGPARTARAPGDDAPAAKAAATEALAAAMPFNQNKPLEIGRDNAVAPAAGATVESDDPRVGASTLSESNPSDKTGTSAAPGDNPTVQSLDRVRVDATGQRLTTNQGVPIGDNQNSLKAGLRGPTLLEDFILREKITHFDHERIPERIVHARGSAAHGYFECTRAIPELTRACTMRSGIRS